MKILLTFLLIIPLLGGCSFTPDAGPSPRSIKANTLHYNNIQSAQSSIQYGFADITLNTKISKISQRNQRYAKVSKNWPMVKASNAVTSIQSGDEVSITIYESEQGGLFLPKSSIANTGNFTTLPSQVIDQTGSITIPYMGRVKVAGRTIGQLESLVVDSLADKAIKPQAVITYKSRKGSLFTILGDVSNSGRYEVGFSDEKILDAIAVAGGANQEQELFVQLTRAGQQSKIHLDRLLSSPELNIRVKPLDTLYLYREPEKFSLFGAAQSTGSYRFGKKKLTLAEALAKGGGLLDDRANPSHVYIFRYEDPKIIEDIGLEQRQKKSASQSSAPVPMIYKIDMKRPQGILLASQLHIEHEDIVYVANAASVKVSKFINIINPSSSASINTRSVISDF